MDKASWASERSIEYGLLPFAQKNITFFGWMTRSELGVLLCSSISCRPCSGRHVPTSSSCSGRRLADLLLQPQHRPVRSGRSRLAAASAAATLTSSRNSCSGYCAADLQQLRPSCFQPPTPVAAPLQLKTAASKLPATAKVAHRSFKGAKIYWCLKT
jgi:hypothetical protein